MSCTCPACVLQEEMPLLVQCWLPYVMHLYTSTGMIQLAIIFAGAIIVTTLIRTYGNNQESIIEKRVSNSSMPHQK